MTYEEAQALLGENVSVPWHDEPVMLWEVWPSGAARFLLPSKGRSKRASFTAGEWTEVQASSPVTCGNVPVEEAS